MLKVSCILCLFLLSPLGYSEFYKYLDDNNRWVYTDSKPLSLENVETIRELRAKQRIEPNIYVAQTSDSYAIKVDNPLFAPIQIELTFLDESVEYAQVDAKSKQTIKTSESGFDEIGVRWVLGRSATNQVINYDYQFPVEQNKPHLITQGFVGKYSHQDKANRFAVDIKLDIGSTIVAARAGIVVSVVEDNVGAGTSQYFLDKANYITVLHDDDTFATYAHILKSSSMVKPGQSVEIGQPIAKSGNSGYSSGPHLHFVVRQNKNFSVDSIPFNFKNRQGIVFKPAAGMKVYGVGP